MTKWLAETVPDIYYAHRDTRICYVACWSWRLNLAIEMFEEKSMVKSINNYNGLPSIPV
jgi:hypothetical protein